MRIVLCLALAALGCSEEKVEPEQKETRSKETKDEAATPTADRTFALRAPSASESPDDLPDDLKQLAEMPPLTAEATPEEINRRIDQSVEALGKFLKIVAASKTCDELGDSLSQFVAVNKRVFDNLQQNLKDPKAAKRLTDLMSKQGGMWIQSVGANLSKCATHPKVIGALTELAPQR